MNNVRALTALLEAEVRRCYPEWGVAGLAPVGSGLENLVCRADSRAFGPVVIRAPWTRHISNANDSGMDARDLLRQEAQLAAHMHRHGVPVPAVHALHLDGEVDFAVFAYVPSDGTRPSPQAMGRMAAAIHAAPPVAEPTVGMAVGELEAVLAERIARRAALAGRLGGAPVRVPARLELERLLTWPGAQRRVLHMDIRPANCLARADEVLAIVDWGNALLGDPALELARIAEHGECGPLEAGFLEGYGDPAPFGRLPRPVELLYRLDTAVMLALVFLSEAPDEALAARFVARSAELAGLLAREL